MQQIEHASEGNEDGRRSAACRHLGFHRYLLCRLGIALSDIQGRLQEHHRHGLALYVLHGTPKNTTGMPLFSPAYNTFLQKKLYSLFD
jgi:hypothetical protein